MSFSNGRLDIIVGPMFSGKSTKLIGDLLINADLGLNVLYINHAFDIRSDKGFSTHHPSLIPKNYKNIDFISLESLKGVVKEEYDVIGIDEAQFFGEDLITFCQIHAEKYRKHVIVVGLDADAQRKKFGHILDLIPLCDRIEKLPSFCKICGSKKIEAIHSHKIIRGGSQLDVGASDKYMPLCREHWLEYNK